MAHNVFLQRFLMTMVVFTTAQAMSMPTRPPPPTTTGPPLLPETPMTTPKMTTVPNACVTEKGDRLAVGETKQYTYDLSCLIYKCESSGQVSTIIGDCFFPPRCVDPVRRPGACCRSCPNGENCKLPSGKVIPAGEDVPYNGLSCRCPKQSWDKIDQDPTKAECEAVPTKAPGCLLPNSSVAADMKPGDKFQPDPCTFCSCDDDWRVQCAVMDCARPPCEDAVVPEGQCCPQCPACNDTSNQCRYWASIGECQKNPAWMLKYCRKSCAVCKAECLDTNKYCPTWSEQGYCDSNPVWMRHNCPASCDACLPKIPTPPPPPTTTTTTTRLPPTTTPPLTTPGCITYFGELVLPGEEKMFLEEGACSICTCQQGEEAMCAIGDCQVPMCVDAYRKPGACCATCPKGRNCRIPSTGEVISAAQPVVRNGLSCECPPQSHDLPGVQRPEHITATCRPVTTLPPPTTEPVTTLATPPASTSP